MREEKGRGGEGWRGRGEGERGVVRVCGGGRREEERGRGEGRIRREEGGSETPGSVHV